MVNDNTNGQSDPLHVGLLENALDSLLSASEAVRRDEGPRSLKEAVLHLANGIELLVKARLALEHWSLIFANIDRASTDKVQGANFTSVGFETAIRRLEGIVRVPISESDISHINNLREERHRLTHFTGMINPLQTKLWVAKTMAFCLEFCEQQNMKTADIQRIFGEVSMNLTKLQVFVDERTKSISAEWKDALIWECPECEQESLVIDGGGEVECKFCRREG